jgi:outer membrane protein, heavy metal efflux system
MKKEISLLVSIHLLITCYGQTTVDSILKQVEYGNKAINANKKYWDAKQLEYKTGLTPYDPSIEYDYMYGSPAGAGNQRDFSVTQRLDFPTAYKRKKELSIEQINQTTIQQNAFRQDVLLEAKLLLLDIIYLNKKEAELARRLTQTEQLLKDYQKKLDQGEVIILDVNKTKLQLHGIKSDVDLTRNERQSLLTKLTELSGGTPQQPLDTIYPVLPVIPDFETLDSTIEANDPLIKIYEHEKLIQHKQIALQKAMNFPKLEAGYHSQGILGQSYRGFHSGIVIPLWENKNKVRTAKAGLDYLVANTDNHRLEHRLENKQLYDQLEVRRTSMQEYDTLLGSLNNTALLDKALRLGQITIMQYFLDQAYYFGAYEKYLQMEKEYHKAVAKLYKFML